MKKLAIFIGRFSPVHDGHMNVIRHACDTSDKVLILVGSSHQPRDMRNPWRYGERVAMLKHAIRDAGLNITKFVFEPLEDFIYQDNLWTRQVQRLVRQHADNMGDNVEVRLHGHNKDETTWYIKAFPQWGEPVTDTEFNSMNATDVRNAFFAGTDPEEIQGISASVRQYLASFKHSQDYQYIVKEYEFQAKHDAMWAQAPYTPTFNTVDSIVVQSGHILLIRRKSHPGLGTWAIPGGYLNPKETQLDSAIRELREETGLKVPEKVLRGSLVAAETFDDPKRSTRGRIITRVFYFQLNDELQLPRVRGGDDADKAQWITLDDFLHMREQMFEDHFSIIRKMLNI